MSTIPATPHTGATGIYASYSGHSALGMGKLDPHCSECDPIYAYRQKMVFAAARVVRDSQVLQDWNDGLITRAEVALAYVQNVGSGYGSGDDFDNRFITVTNDWDAYADEQADELLLDGVSETVRRYFDYELWRQDLKYDYDVVETHSSLDIVFTQ